MHIAYIINSVEGGGAALPVPDIAGVMRDAGHRVTILALTRRDGRALPALEKAGLTVHVREGGKKDHWRGYRWLDRQIQTLKPDLLWTSLTRATLLGQIVGARRKVPVVSWQHNARVKPANIFLLRLLRQNSMLWIADSQSVSRLAQDVLRIDDRNLMTWPIFRADSSIPVSRPWQEGDVVQIGSLGRLHPQKNYDVLCAAIQQLLQRPGLPPFRVTIAGEGDERPKLEALIKRDGLPITLAGYLAAPQSLLAGLHLYTQPSKGEGLCIAAHEAMLSGLPIIASSTGELPHTITPQFGRIVPPDDATALADALESFLRQPHNFTVMGQLARARVLEKFNADRFACQGRAILKRIETSLPQY